MTSTEGKPLIFISHDGRDADLAEAFSKLLKRASAGVLESFRFTDPYGTEGVAYGADWYDILIQKLRLATDVVCLFTPRSLARPWLLFEAGVARGFDKPVHGVALGVSIQDVSEGPFGRFHNCGSDEKSILGLTMQLVDKAPLTDPPEDMVRDLVRTFKGEADAMISKIGDDEQAAPTAEDASPVRYLDEMKAMFWQIMRRMDSAAALAESRPAPTERGTMRQALHHIIWRVLSDKDGRATLKEVLDAVGRYAGSFSLEQWFDAINMLIQDRVVEADGDIRSSGTTLTIVTSYRRPPQEDTKPDPGEEE